MGATNPGEEPDVTWEYFKQPITLAAAARLLDDGAQGLVDDLVTIIRVLAESVTEYSFEDFEANLTHPQANLLFRALEKREA